MSILQTLFTILTPLPFFFIPGIALFNKNNPWPVQIGRILLWSISSWILLLWIAAYCGISLFWAAGLILVVTIGLLYRQRSTFFTIETTWKFLMVLIPFFTLYTLLSVPLLIYHEGLPTGDSQKAIFWADTINQTGTLPDYSLSISTLNRDPVDFYTPGLHAMVAFLNRITGFLNDPILSLAAISFFALAMAICTAFLAGIWAFDISQQKSIRIIVFTIIFVLSNSRFLRYIREPGYHLQNLLGELLLFGLIWIAVTFRHRRRWEDIVLGTFIAAALVISHQFSSFIAAFMLIPIFINFIIDMRSHMAFLWQQHRLPVVGALLAMIAALLSGASLGLGTKIPHIFSLTPHLLFEVPQWSDYFRLMGVVSLSAAMAGFVVMLLKKTNSARTWEQRTFVASIFVLSLLSQGPRLGIDIPPIRALLYMAVPLSIGAAFFFDYIYQRRQLAFSLFVTLLLIIPIYSATAELSYLSHAVRTNSTLTLGQVAINKLISERATDTAQAILIDDYDRRSSSWLLLSKQPIFSRIAADLAVQMAEAKQSMLRRNLYLNHLDYEKIIDLGSRSEIAPLLDKHSVRWITGIKGSSESSLKYNPLLTPLTFSDDITLFERHPQTTSSTPSFLAVDIQAWLLRSSTLANDIGDEEDTFEHLPASLRTTRLSTPQIQNHQTWRTTTAPIIPLVFNVRDYVEILWSHIKTSHPDQALELLLEFKGSPTDLIIQTPDGQKWPVQNAQPIRLEAANVYWDANGFVTIFLLNPKQYPLNIDLIALGLARIP